MRLKQSLCVDGIPFPGNCLLRVTDGHAVRAGYRFYSYGDATLIL